ncbi:DUF3106 domain-containing protein [Massilia forsythiae]|uniref:DUF3106 domain-containing protein n=1 Tax=Massilia forsythiae TaxID=2728020 RepID=UPI001B7CEC17|nr:DUF3106 domain-containing protein [Massilia forsythiae]
MTANKRKVAGLAVAAAVLVAGTAALVIGRQGAIGPSAGDAAGDGAAVRQVQAGLGAASVRKIGDKPYWRALTPAQQVALQPLQGEWDGMDGVRKQKWLQLASRFGAMRPEERERVHERMREWVKLTPEQRELARETYTRTRKIAPEQKNATWQSYQQLSNEQKEKLAASAAGRAVPAVPSQANAKVVPLGQGASACPAGTVRNAVSATPPCVAAPAAPAVPASNPAAPPAGAPATPAPPAQQEKPVPANWGITPNNA